MGDRRENVGKKLLMKPLESFGIGRMMTDEDFRITEISEQSANLLGATADFLIAKQLSSDIGPERDVLEEAAGGKIRLSKCKTADGATANICFRVMKVDGADSSGYDVIFLKESQALKCTGGESAHFQEVVHELEYNSAQTLFLERLIESTGHDLKTPLGIILGYCELLFKGKANGSTAEQERIHKTIYKNCAWISEMVERLEDFSSIVRRCKEERRSRVNFAAVLKETAAKLYKSSFTSQVKLCVEGEETAEITASPSVLAALCEELMKNAILYCRKDREVVFTVSLEGGKASASMEIPALEEDAPSINHLLDRIFVQPPDFHRESQETKTFCLGLGAVRYLVMLLGGSLTASSGRKESAVIAIEFPAAG